MCQMSSSVSSAGFGETLSLWTSLPMIPKSNERRMQRALKHARHALIDQTFRSRSIDRQARRSRRWSTATLVASSHTGYKRKCSRKKPPHFRLLYGFADLPERGAPLSYIYVFLVLRIDLPRHSAFFASVCVCETNGNVTSRVPRNPLTAPARRGFFASARRRCARNAFLSAYVHVYSHLM